MGTSAKICSTPVAPGVGNAFELDAAGTGVAEGDPAGVDPPDDDAEADDGGLAVRDGAGPDDPALGCGALTEVVRGAEGPPECEAMQAVLVRASAATAQPLAAARTTRIRKTLMVSIATDPGMRTAGP